ncbi:MAG: translocation/assembly module TamB domain-containing protein [Bacteroidia bacterium]|nr:translocation/assembly module TamB domain-containing protein [Bacteroidia bacterium]
MKRILRTTFRTLRAIVVSLSLLVLLALWALRSEWAQNQLVPILENAISDALGVQIEIGTVDIDLPAYAVLTDLKMRDAQHQDMFAVKRLKVGFGSFSLLDFILHPKDVQSIKVSDVQLLQPTAHLYRSRRDSIWNYNCLNSASEDTTPSKPLKLRLEFPSVNLKGGEFSMIDSTKSDSILAISTPMNFSNLHFKDIHSELSYQLEPGLKMFGHIERFSVSEVRSQQSVSEFSTGYLIQLRPEAPSKLNICIDGARLKVGRTHLDLDAGLDDIRPDSLPDAFHPVFTVQFRPSTFDFRTLNKLLPKPLPMAEPMQVQGLVWGDMNGIFSDSLFVGLLEKTRLRTTLALTDFTHSDDLKFGLGIEQGILSFEELQRFLPDSEIPLRGVVALRGNVVGTLTQLKTQKLEVRYMEQTHLLVDARITDYTKGDLIFMDIKFKNSKFRFDELKHLMPEMNLPPWLSKFGTCGIDGKFLGGINDFVVNAEMTSAFGNVNSNLHLQLPPKVRQITYDGWISTQHLNFDALGADLPVASNDFNFEGRIDGSGTSWGTMNANIDGTIQDSDLEGYRIEKIFTSDLKLRGYKITGGVDVVDAHGAASVVVDLDLPDSSQHFFVVGDIKHLDLAQYGILPSDSVFFSAIINLNLDGKNIEDYTGKLRFLQAALTRKDSEDSLELKNAVITSKLDENKHHSIKLRSSMADMDLLGRFRYDQAAKIIGNLATEARLFLKNNDSLTLAYYEAKVQDSVDFQFTDTIRTKAEINHALAFFQVPLYLEPGTMVAARFEHGSIDDLEIKMHSDSIGYAAYSLDQDSVYISIMKDGGENHFLGNGFVQVKTLSLSENLHFSNLTIEPSADANQVDYFMRASQPETGSAYVISGSTNFFPGGEIKTQIHADESKLTIRGKPWTFAQGNSIVHLYEKPPSLAKLNTDSVISRYHLRGLKLMSEGQEISFGGVISTDRLDMMNIDIRNLSIRNVLEVLENQQDIDGRVKWATIGARNLLKGQPAIFGSGEVVNFRYQLVDSIGIRFKGGWPDLRGNDYASLRVELGKWRQDSAIVHGWYNMKNDSIHFDADSSTFQLSWIGPFVEGILSEMEGKIAVDNFKVRGTLKKPELDGIARFTNSSFKVDYLNNVFRIGDNQLKFDNQRVNISRIMLHDTLGGSAELNGSVLYNDPNGAKLDIRLDNVDNLLFMDTRKEDNDVFYGHIVIDGDSAKVTGKASAPHIDAWVNTGNNSWLDIPISSYTSANRLDFVNFIQKGDTLHKEKKADFGGLSMTLNVNARSNARVRLIFDEFVGDVIEARGDGNIIVKVDEDGEFNMFGAYIVDRGDYHFTMENVLNKKFSVNKGGRIVWNGDPFDALVDLEAVYKVNADMSAILGNSGSGNRVPVEIVMHMTGSLMTPEIALELRLEMSEQDVFGLATFFQGIQYDQQELNKQVVSLLLFRRFASTSTSATASNSGANVTGSLSELVSNQVNHWLSQTFSDPKLGVEVLSNDFQDVQLALTASLFNDRVTVERNGTLIGNNSGNLSIGDLTVLIKVLPKVDTTGNLDPNAGQLVMEIFNREDASITNANNITRGTGLFYKKDFDRLKEFFETRKAMRKEEGVEIKGG